MQYLKVIASTVVLIALVGCDASPEALFGGKSQAPGEAQAVCSVGIADKNRAAPMAFSDVFSTFQRYRSFRSVEMHVTQNSGEFPVVDSVSYRKRANGEILRLSQPRENVFDTSPSYKAYTADLFGAGWDRYVFHSVTVRWSSGRTVTFEWGDISSPAGCSSNPTAYRNARVFGGSPYTQAMPIPAFGD